MNMTKVFWSFPRRTAVPVFVGPKTFLMRILWSDSPMLSSCRAGYRDRARTESQTSGVPGSHVSGGPAGKTRTKRGKGSAKQMERVREEISQDLFAHSS